MATEEVVEVGDIEEIQVLNDEGAPKHDDACEIRGPLYFSNSKFWQEDVEAGGDEVPGEEDYGFADCCNRVEEVEPVVCLYSECHHAESLEGLLQLNLQHLRLPVALLHPLLHFPMVFILLFLFLIACRLHEHGLVLIHDT